VVQGFANFGARQSTVLTLGAKYGATSRVEVGLDANAGRTAAVPGLGGVGAGGAPASIPVLQAKYRVVQTHGGFGAAVGFANLSWDTTRAGAPAGYVTLSQTMGEPRLHVGYLHHGVADICFAGVDAPAGETTLRADLNHTFRGGNLLSAGFITRVSPRIYLEGWASATAPRTTETTFTLKLNYLFD